MKKIRHHLRKNFIELLLSFLAGVFLVAFTFFWLSMPYTFGDEEILIKWTTLVKKRALNFGARQSPDDVLFVDVSNSKTIIPRLNEFGEPSPYFREVITDRTLLAEFLGMVKQHGSDAKLIVLDVLLADSTESDSLLQVQIDSLGDKILAASQILPDGRIVKPSIKVPHAIATYLATKFLFMKYRLVFQDSLRTLPLAMHEKINNVTLRKEGSLFWMDRNPVLINPIIDYKVLKTEFETGTDFQEKHYTIYPLGTLLEANSFMETADLKALFQNKIVIVGDFVNDIHWTPFDELAGPLLIYNAYLTTAAGENKIYLSWVLMLLAGYSFLCYRLIKDIQIKSPRWLVRLFQSRMSKVVLNSLDEVFLLAVITTLSYLIFNIHINILILFFFIKLMEFVFAKLKPVFAKINARIHHSNAPEK